MEKKDLGGRAYDIWKSKYLFWRDFWNKIVSKLKQ